MTKRKIIIGIFLVIFIIAILGLSVTPTEHKKEEKATTLIVEEPTKILPTIEEPTKITNLRFCQVGNYYVLFTLWKDDKVMKNAKGIATVKIVDKSDKIIYQGTFNVSRKNFYDMFTAGRHYFFDVYVLEIREGEIKDIGDKIKIELTFITPSGKKLAIVREFTK